MCRRGLIMNRGLHQHSLISDYMRAVELGIVLCRASDAVISGFVYYPPNRGYCFQFVCLSVRLSVCLSVRPSETLCVTFCAANSS